MRLSHQNHPRSLETHASWLSRWRSQVVEAPEADTGPLLSSAPKPPNRLRSYPPALPTPRPPSRSLTAIRNQLLRN